MEIGQLAATPLNNGLVVFRRVAFSCAALVSAGLSPKVGRAFDHLCPVAVCVLNAGNGADEAAQHEQAMVTFRQGSPSIGNSIPMSELVDSGASHIGLGCAASQSRNADEARYFHGLS